MDALESVRVAIRYKWDGGDEDVHILCYSKTPIGYWVHGYSIDDGDTTMFHESRNPLSYILNEKEMKVVDKLGIEKGFISILENIMLTDEDLGEDDYFIHAESHVQKK